VDYCCNFASSTLAYPISALSTLNFILFTKIQPQVVWKVFISLPSMWICSVKFTSFKFSRHVVDSLIAHLIYVDDIVLTRNSLHEFGIIKSVLPFEFGIRKIRVWNFSLGLRWECSLIQRNFFYVISNIVLRYLLSVASSVANQIVHR